MSGSVTASPVFFTGGRGEAFVLLFHVPHIEALLHYCRVFAGPFPPRGCVCFPLLPTKWS